MRRLITLLTALALLAAACSSDDAEPSTTTAGEDSTTTTTTTTPSSPVSGLISSDIDRFAPDATDAELETIGAAERAFATALYQVVAAGDGNLVVSPISVQIAMLMAYAGAEGDTAAEMTEALGVSAIAADRLHDMVNALDQLLESYNREEEPLPEGTEQKVVLSIVNALWGQAGFGFEDDYLDLLAGSYGAGLHVVDFVGATEAARQEINAWVADQTNDRITDLIPAGALGPMTRLVITNAVYLDATWQIPFDPEATEDGEFTLLDGTTATVPFMHGDPMAPYAAGDGWQAFELAYTGGDLAMLVILPDERRFAEVDAFDGFVERGRNHA